MSKLTLQIGHHSAALAHDPGNFYLQRHQGAVAGHLLDIEQRYYDNNGMDAWTYTVKVTAPDGRQRSRFGTRHQSPQQLLDLLLRSLNEVPVPEPLPQEEELPF